MGKIKTITFSIILMIASSSVNAIENNHRKITYENKEVTVIKMETVYKKEYIQETIKGYDGRDIKYTRIKSIPITKEVKYNIIKRVPVFKDVALVKENKIQQSKFKKEENLIISRRLGHECAIYNKKNRV